ncbi:MAG: membrane protein insertase YidC, partial [Proteobacteria bacterium]|nr:membrane protein insertase YidC [Pseudomonadota bacterium]
MNDQRNMLLAVVLSVVIIIAFQFFFESRRPPPPETAQQTQQPQVPEGVQAPRGAQVPERPVAVPQAPAKGAEVPSVPGATQATPVAVDDRRVMLAKSKRVKIRSPRLHGSIALTGGRIDDLTLADYRETLDETSPEIILLSPHGAPDAYFAQFGWVPADGVVVPGPDTPWTANRDVLAPGSPLTLTWDNGQGLRFSRIYAIDENYMFTVTQRIENTGSTPAALYPYGLISRWGTPEVTGFFILHEGPLGVFDGTLTELDYDDLQDAGTIRQSTTGGWIGITDKYWLAALVPDQKSPVNTRFKYFQEGGTDRYQVDFLGNRVEIAAGAVAETVSHLFTGAKEVDLLDAYEERYRIDRFDLAIDFGWFYFLTKPIFYGLIYINDYIGNFGFSILLLTVGIKLVFFPLANKSYTAMSKVKKLQPQILKLRERFGDDKVRLNTEMMALYKRENASPASGCLPMIIQIPVFFALYKVLFVTIEMRHAPFFGWIHDLSAADPTSVWNLFGLIPWDPTVFVPDVINIGVWPIIMGASM